VAAATRRSRAQSLTRPLLLRLLFAILVLVPMSGLFVPQWRGTDDARTFHRLQRQGVEYLGALGPLTAALTKAQSAAVAGGSVDTAELSGVIASVAEVDGRLGGALGTRTRWTNLRSRVEQLSAAKPASGQPAFDAYRETTDQLLALYARVRENSNLSHDPNADVWDLADGVAEKLPGFVVAAGRFSDLALIFSGIVPAAPPSTRDDAATTAARLAQDRALAVARGRVFAAQVAVSSPADGLTADLQNAVAVSESPTLGTNVFKSFGALRQTIDAMTDPAILADGQLTPAEVASLGALRGTAADAVNPLYIIVLDEVDKLIAGRLDGVERDRTIAIVAAGLAVLIAVSPMMLLSLARVRTGREPEPSGRHGKAEEDTGAQSYPTWSPAGPDLPSTPLPQRERSGAAR
jgi:hypothetical protein